MADQVNFGDTLVTPEEKTRRVGGVFTSVAKSYDVMNDLMSGGMHRLWKDRFVAKVKPRPGEYILDMAGGTGEFFPRPDLVGDPFANTRGPDRYLNLAAFRVPCTLDPAGDGSAASCIPGTQHFGSLGRNSLVGPDYRNFDFSVFKTTPLTEE